jgi:hypothetical protein
MVMPKPGYTTPKEWQKMINSKSWQEYKKKAMARGVKFGPGL